MPVTVIVRGRPLAETPLTSRELMREVGLLARERIYRRTVSGRDQFDAAFAGYSAGYEERKRQELGSANPVNLQVSGDMLNAMTITEVTENTVTLGFVR